MISDENKIPLFGLIGQIMHLSMERARQMFGQYDLKPGQAGILLILNKEGEMSQRELSEKMNLTQPSITAAIQKMERQGYIRRTPDSRDQRMLRLSLTEKSRALIQRAKEDTARLEETMLTGISLEERLLLRRILTQMRENLLEGKEFGDFPFKHPPQEPPI